MTEQNIEKKPQQNTNQSEEDINAYEDKLKSTINDEENRNQEKSTLEENDEENRNKEKSTLEETSENVTDDVDEDKKINDLENELEETKDKMLRVLAESENTRKQMEKNRIDMAKYGVQPLARELINVVDNFERALNSLSEDTEKKTLEGFELIKKEILSMLEKFNVKKIKALGEAFDANIHQAMFEKPANDYSNGEVCEIVQDGYMFHDRLLRPAMVGITKNEQKKENVDEAQERSPKDHQEQN